MDLPVFIFKIRRGSFIGAILDDDDWSWSQGWTVRRAAEGIAQARLSLLFGWERAQDGRREFSLWRSDTISTWRRRIELGYTHHCIVWNDLWCTKHHTVILLQQLRDVVAVSIWFYPLTPITSTALSLQGMCWLDLSYSNYGSLAIRIMVLQPPSW